MNRADNNGGFKKLLSHQYNGIVMISGMVKVALSPRGCRLFLLLVFLSSPLPAQVPPKIADISVQRAERITRENEHNNKFQIIDIRTPKEYKYGHLERSLLINYYDQDFTAQMEQLNRDKTYLIYCHSGGRTREAVKVVKQLGFKHVYFMPQGIVGWARAGFKIVR